MIHQYKNNGYNIVIDVNSGSVHVVDDIVYDMIGLIEPLVNEGIKEADLIKAAVLNCGNFKHPEEEMLEAVDEVLELEKMGQLFATDLHENRSFDLENGCKKCFAKFYCSGDCAANSDNFQGNINGAYDVGCELQRKRIEHEIMIKAALAETEEEN